MRTCLNPCPPTHKAFLHHQSKSTLTNSSSEIFCKMHEPIISGMDKPAHAVGGVALWRVSEDGFWWSGVLQKP